MHVVGLLSDGNGIIHDTTLVRCWCDVAFRWPWYYPCYNVHVAVWMWWGCFQMAIELSMLQCWCSVDIVMLLSRSCITIHDTTLVWCWCGGVGYRWPWYRPWYNIGFVVLMWWCCFQTAMVLSMIQYWCCGVDVEVWLSDGHGNIHVTMLVLWRCCFQTAMVLFDRTPDTQPARDHPTARHPVSVSVPTLSVSSQIS